MLYLSLAAQLLFSLQARAEDRPSGVSFPWTDSDVELLQSGGVQCRQVHETVLHVITNSAQQAAAASHALIDRIPWLLEQLESKGDGGDTSQDYASLFTDPTSAVQLALEALRILSLAAMAQRACFHSSARLILGKSLKSLQAALQQQVSTMWWMFDIGQYSNTNSPVKHLQALLSMVKKSEAVFQELAADLPEALVRSEHFWGHQEHGMFVNTTVIYRSLFPESAILDKGLLRMLLRLLPQDSTVADFGSLDGHYSRWLNDTGWVTAFAFDGVEGIEQLTDGIVTQVDLAEKLDIAWHPDAFDWVLCLEVAEHIPPSHEQRFLWNLQRYASQGLVLSWAPPGIEGEGHVNCQELDESRKRVEALGFRMDEEATNKLREASQVPWISASVAVYRREQDYSGLKTT